LKLLCILLSLVLSSSLAYADHGKISLQLKWKHQFQFAGYYMALEKGYYRDAGLAVSLIEASAEKQPIQQVLDQHNTYAITDTGALLARANGKPIKAIGAIFQHSPLALMVLKSSGINTLNDLRGKRIMLEKGYQGVDIRALLKVGAGLSAHDFIFQPSSFDLQDLIQGNTDAFSIYIMNEPKQMATQNIPYKIFYPKEYGVDFYGDILVTSDSEVEQHPERAEKFLRATALGWNYALEHVDEALDLILLKYNTQHLSRQHLQFEANAIIKLMETDLLPIGYMNKYRWQQIVKIYANEGLMPANYPISDFIYQPVPSTIDWIKGHAWQLSLSILLLLVLILGLFVLVLRKTVQLSVHKLSESEGNLRNLIELADFGILVHREGRIVFANTYTLELLNIPSLGELLNRSVLAYVHPDDRGEVGSRMAKVMQHGEIFHRQAVRQISDTGNQHDVEVSSMPIQYEGRRSILTIFLDVSEKKCAEAVAESMRRQVEHTQRLESLGVLAGGIAHDFKQFGYISASYCR